MVATGDHVDVLMLEDVEGVFAFGLTPIIETVALDTISSVDQEKIRAIFIGSLMQVLGEAYVVAPVCTVLGLLQVPTVPAVGVFGGEQRSARGLANPTRIMTYL